MNEGEYSDGPLTAKGWGEGNAYVMIGASEERRSLHRFEDLERLLTDFKRSVGPGEFLSRYGNLV